MEFHEITNLFLMMEGEEYVNLKNDILTPNRPFQKKTQ